MAYYPAIYKNGSEGFDNILTEGQVSTTSDYATANFNDISDYTYLFIKFYYTYNDSLRTFYSGLYVNNIPVNSYYDFVVRSEAPTNNLSVRITRTSIALTHYNGDWLNIYCDIKGTKISIWD